MPKTVDPIAHWSRELADVRTRTLQPRFREEPVELQAATLDLCDRLLRELAGAHLESERLRQELKTEAATWIHLFDVNPGPCVLTDEAGVICSANRAAAVLLNTSSRRLQDRPLLLFSQNRTAFAALLKSLGQGAGDVRTTLLFQPRERKTVSVDLLVVPLSADRTDRWVWFLSQGTDVQAWLQHESQPPHAARGAQPCPVETSN